MSDYKTKNNTGALFNNSENKTSEKHPDYTGKAMVNGDLISIGAWINESKSGKKYLGLKFSELKPKTVESKEWTTTASDNAEIPF